MFVSWLNTFYVTWHKYSWWDAVLRPVVWKTWAWDNTCIFRIPVSLCGPVGGTKVWWSSQHSRQDRRFFSAWSHATKGSSALDQTPVVTQLALYCLFLSIFLLFGVMPQKVESGPVSTIWWNVSVALWPLLTKLECQHGVLRRSQGPTENPHMNVW